MSEAKKTEIVSGDVEALIEALAAPTYKGSALVVEDLDVTLSVKTIKEEATGALNFIGTFDEFPPKYRVAELETTRIKYNNGDAFINKEGKIYVYNGDWVEVDSVSLKNSVENPDFENWNTKEEDPDAVNIIELLKDL